METPKQISHDKVVSLLESRHLQALKTSEKVGSAGNLNLIAEGDYKKTFDYIEKFTGSKSSLSDPSAQIAMNYGKAVYREAKQNAQDQGMFGAFAGFAAQAVAGEIALGTVAGLGYLLDVQSWGAHVMGGEADWGNWLSDYAEAGKKGIAEAMPIYQDPDNENRTTFQNMMHGDGWWAQNGVSVASSVSILLPVLGWARGVSMLGKGLGMLGAAARLGKAGRIARATVSTVDKVMDVMPMMGKTTKLALDGIHKATVSRIIENQMEATGVFKERYDFYKSKGLDEDAAKAAAGKAAGFTFNANWGAMITDIPQYMLMGSSGAALKSSLTKLKPGWVTNSAILNKTAKLRAGLFQMGSEGAEEAYQFMVAEEGKRVGDIHAGLRDENDSSFGERFKKYTDDSEMWTSALFGALGGGVFSALGPKAEKLSHKLFRKGEAFLTTEDVRLAEEKERFVRTSHNADILASAVESGDTEAIHGAKSNIAFDLASNAVQVNNWEKARVNILQLKNATKEERIAQGIDDNFDDFIADIDVWVKHMDAAAVISEQAQYKYRNGLAQTVARRQFQQYMYNENTPIADNAIIAEKNKVIPNYNMLSKDGNTVVDKIVEIRGKEKQLDQLEQEIKSGRHSDHSIPGLQTQLENGRAYVKQELEGLKAITSVEGAITTIDQLAIDAVEGGSADELVSLSTKRQWLDVSNIHNTEELNYLTSRKGRRDYNDKMERAAQEELSKQKEEKIQRKTEKAKQEVKPEESTNSEFGEKSVFDIKNLNDASLKEVSDAKKGEFFDWNAYANNPEELNMLQKAVADWEELHDENPHVSQQEAEDKASLGEDTDNTDETFNEAEEVSDIELPLDTESTDRDFAADFEAEENAIDEYEEMEIPANPDDFSFYRVSDDRDDMSLSSVANQLAWLSVNNPESDLEPTEANKALSSYLENPANTLEDVDIEFQVNREFIEKFEKENPGSTKYSEMLTAIDGGLMPSDAVIGYLPVKAILKKKGVQIEHDGQKLEMSMHDPDFFFNTDGSPKFPGTSESLATSAILQKKLIIQQMLKGNVVTTSVKYKSNGKINSEYNEDGQLAKKNVLTTLKKSLQRIQLLVGNKTGKYLTHNKQVRLSKFSSARAGAIYTQVETATGAPVPLRLQVSNVSVAEANLLHTLYSDLLTDPELISESLSKGIVEYIKTSNKAEIKALLDIFPDIENVTYDKLLNSLVYQGKSTEKSTAGRLVYYANTSYNGKPMPNTVKFGTENMTKERLNSTDGQKAFIDWVSKNKRRQVDMSRLGDETYKHFLFSNEILTTNVVASKEGHIFVQPVIGFKSKMEVKNRDTVVNNKSSVENVERRSEELGVMLTTFKAITAKDFNWLSAKARASEYTSLEEAAIETLDSKYKTYSSYETFLKEALIWNFEKISEWTEVAKKARNEKEKEAFKNLLDFWKSQVKQYEKELSTLKESDIKVEIPKAVEDIKSIMSTISMFQTGIKTEENKEIVVNLPENEDFEETPCKK